MLVPVPENTTDMLVEMGFEDEYRIYVPYIFLYHYSRKTTLTLTKKELKHLFSRHEIVKEHPPIEFVLCTPSVHTLPDGVTVACFIVPRFIMEGKYGNYNNLIDYLRKLGYKYNDRLGIFLAPIKEQETKSFIDYYSPFGIIETVHEVTPFDLSCITNHFERAMDITLINADDRVTEMFYEEYRGEFILTHELPYGNLEQSIDSLFPSDVEEDSFDKVVIAFDTSDNTTRNSLFSRLKKYSRRSGYRVFLLSNMPSLLAYGLSIQLFRSQSKEFKIYEIQCE
jgi:hypothetical protein